MSQIKRSQILKNIIGIDRPFQVKTSTDGGGMMTMAPGMEVASSSNPSTSDPLSPHTNNARSPVNAAAATSWYPPTSVTDPRYTSSAHVDHMMMPGASSLHRGSPPVASGVLPIDTQQHAAAAMAVDNPAAFFSAASSAAEASRYYQMHQAYENAATQGNRIIYYFFYIYYVSENICRGLINYKVGNIEIWYF